MRIQRIALKNFRTYDYADFTFSPTTNVLIGKNAQGKTNLIEAIYLLSVAKSFRTRLNQEMIMFEREFAKIIGLVQTKTSQKNLEMVLFEKGKQAKINQALCHKTSEFVGIFNVVVFTPDDLFFVKGSPKIRMRFMDIELSKISSLYLSYFNSFQHFFKERNQYLKQAGQTRKRDDVYLDVITHQMIDVQIEIAKQRTDFIAKLNDFTKQIYKKISQHDENITLVYETFFDVNSPSVKEDLIRLYEEDKEKDYRYGKTNQGVNKDDIKVLLNDKEACQFASQGQQRSIVLAMKIGLLKLIYEEIGEYPVLLLDDVLSELDNERQNLLLNLVSDDIQTFITTTSIDGLSHEVIQRANKIEISKERS